MNIRKNKMKGLGKVFLQSLRWVIWVGLLLIFIRGAAIIILPPVREQTVSNTAQSMVEPDGLRAFPQMFAGEYLTWQAGNPSERAQRLKPYLAKDLDSQAGWSLGEGGLGQAVQWLDVYGVQPLKDQRWLITIAARIRVLGKVNTAQNLEDKAEEQFILLSVPVAKSSNGWVIYDYPSLLPLPFNEDYSGSSLEGQVITDEGERVQKLLSGYFRAYTGEEDVTYYFLPDTNPPERLTGFLLDRIEEVTLLKNGSETLAQSSVALRDLRTKARYLNRYTFRLEEKDGRWYIKEIIEGGL